MPAFPRSWWLPDVYKRQEDVLATKELAKLSAVIALVNRNFGQELTIGRITQEDVYKRQMYRSTSCNRKASEP